MSDNPQVPEYPPIDAYGMIGDLHTIALISQHGSIDWLSAPVFDSQSVFAKLLDTNIGGHFSIDIKNASTHKTEYIHDTNILRGKQKAPHGEIEIIDYMPILNEDGTRPDLQTTYICRHLECTRGVQISVEIQFNPAPDYARAKTALHFDSKYIYDPVHDLYLYTSVPIVWDPEKNTGSLVLSQGDQVRFLMQIGKTKPFEDLIRWTDQTLRQTKLFWQNWLSTSVYKGRYRGMVERSALALKLLHYHPTGAIVAAPTTSLPEELGGERNWDYRFSWLRDSAWTINALLKLGFTNEAKSYMHWLVRKNQQNPDLETPILYSISDVDTTEEISLDHLSGYKNSQPVRIGNAASHQRQLDIFGEVIDSIYQFSQLGQTVDEIMWETVTEFAEKICTLWQEKDEGIWEVRNGRQHFTYSKLMCWVGLDRAVNIARAHGFRAPIAKWLEEMEAIRSFILTHAVHPEKKYLQQHPSSSACDASTLLAALVGFLPVNHAIIQNTINEVIETLVHNKAVYRYHTADGLSGGEGAFHICTFWLIEALALSGRLEEASDYFHTIINRTGPLSLFAEEIDPDTGLALGNYPQAFSHIGLIHAAISLHEKIQTSDPDSVSFLQFCRTPKVIKTEDNPNPA